MKTIALSLSFFLTLGLLNAQNLVIYHTNDTHSQLTEISHGNQKGLGGVAKRKSFIDAQRAKDSLSLLLDVGDAVQGTPYFTLFKGRPEMEIMNSLGYEATALGNHEFDNGLESLAENLALANFPIVCSNYDFKGTALEPYVKNYAILEKQGVKIGIIGLTPILEGLVSKRKIEGLQYKNPIQQTLLYADSLKENYGCKWVVCLSHLGYAIENPDGINDSILIANTRNIDVLIGGHSHTLLEKAVEVPNLLGRLIPLVQAGSRGAYVGRVELIEKP